MKLYEVSYQVTSVIAAKDFADAVVVARSCAKEAICDSKIVTQVETEIRNLDMLPEGWVKECLPFGVNDEKRISDYIGEAV